MLIRFVLVLLNFLLVLDFVLIQMILVLLNLLVLMVKIGICDFLIDNIKAIRAMGFPWEMEIADMGFLNNALRLAQEGVFDPKGTDFWLDYCLGFGAMPATARHLVFAQDEGQRLFPNAKWAVLATGRDQFPMSILGASMGCDIVRIGFEDNIYLPDGRPARQNHELITAMAHIARDLGREVASVNDAREIFGVG